MTNTGRRILAALLGIVLGAGLAAISPAGAARSAGVPGAAAWLEASRTGAPLMLTVEGRTLDLRLSGHDGLFEPGAEIRDGSGQLLDGDIITPLTGHVVGIEGSWARVTVGADTVVGVVWAPGIGSVAIAPRPDGVLAAATGSEIAAALAQVGADTRIEPGGVEAAEDCDSLMWQPQVAPPTTLLDESPLRTFNVAFAVDGTFEANHPDWATLATGFVNAADAVFRSAFGIRISIEHLIAIPDVNVPGTTTSEMLDSLQDYYVATYPTLARENVHLFTGRDPTNAAGQVNCVGSVGRTTVSYSVSQGDPGGPFGFPGGLVLLPDGAMKILAHELGHTLSAHHHYANCAESAPGFDPFVTMDVCTVMINDWGLIQPVFSSLSRLTVRGWADHYDV